MTTKKLPVIALTNKVFPQVEQLMEYCRENGCGGVEYSFPYLSTKPDDITGEKDKIARLVRTGLEIRYHCPFFVSEMAASDWEAAKNSLDLYKKCVDFISGFGACYLTVHIGLGSASVENLNYDTAINHLSELVAHGRNKKVTVCLENLTKGWTGHPLTFREMIEKTGAGITFDLGHVNACPWVLEAQGTSLDFLENFSAEVINAHIYEIEKTDQDNNPYHVYPRDLTIIRPLLRQLVGGRCDWWLIELSRFEEVDHTRFLLSSFSGEIV